MSDYTSIKLDRDGSIAILTLARPNAGNSLDARTGQELKRAAESLTDDFDVRALLIKAEGRAFCVGGDLVSFKDLPDMGPAIREMVGDFHGACLALAALKIPVVCAVQGPAAGAGLALIGLSDHVISIRKATFTYAYPQVGFSADGGVTWLLPRLMGVRNFQAFVLGGKSIDGDEALRMGLISQVVDEDAEAAALALCQALAQGPTGAYGAIRRLGYEGLGRSYGEHLNYEQDAIAGLAGGIDAPAAIRAFVAREKPTFTGR